MTKRIVALAIALLLGGLSAPIVPLQASTSGDPYELLHVFEGPEGLYPIGGLVEGADGLYGTTASGGDNDCGVIFRMDAAGSVTVLHSFGWSDGCAPFGTLAHVGNGDLYGTTYEGGTYSYGTVFKLDAAGAFSVVRDFAGGPDDGARPVGSLIQATDGDIYGTTSAGGAAGRGTAFRMDLAGTVTILHSFGVTEGDGFTPWAGLIQASDGYFYGATVFGGNPNPPECGCNDRTPWGTVFRMDPAGNVVIRYNFSGDDGREPYGSLLEVNGILYGTTAFGGWFDDGTTNAGGVLFAMPLDDKLEPVHMFGSDALDGQLPYGALIRGNDGALYGTTNLGGALSGGTVFRVDLDAGPAVTILHAFEFSQSGTSVQPGMGPVGPLLQVSDGNIYGTASGVIGFETAAESGVLFRIRLVEKSNQTISFGPLATRTYGDASFAVSATASSSLPVTFSASGNCTISGAMVTLTGAGACTVTASQPGDASFNAAPDVQRTFPIVKAAATLTLSNLVQAYDGTPKPVTATTSPAGLTAVSVTYNGSANAPTEPGSYAVTAILIDSNYQAPNATGTLVITGGTAVTLSLSPTSIVGGTSSTGTVTLALPAPTAGAVVNLISSNPGVATVPATATIMKGKTTKTFTVTTSMVAGATTVNIVASYGGSTKAVTLTVNPPAPAALSALGLNPKGVAGGSASTATVTLTGAAPAGGLLVTLISSNPNVAANTSITVSAGSTSASVPIATFAVSATTSVTITATGGGVSKSATLTVRK